jgi:ABC-type multidrug transport system ATPase subunit
LSSLLEVDDLVVRFGDQFCVGPAGFRMDAGLLHVEGPNGGGKTTLLRAIAGELEPASGAARVHGLDVHRSIAARRQIALVPSAPELPDFLSVAEACEFTAGIRGAPDWSGVDYLEALDLDGDLPLGNASSGQRRKAELVSGLAGDPTVLLLDETFAHLDSRSVDLLEQWVVEWRRSRVVVITHHGRPPVAPDATLHVAGREVRLEGRCAQT